MNSRNETTPHPPGTPKSDDAITDLAERCRLLAAQIDHIRRSHDALDHGDRDSAELQDGHDPGHAIGYVGNLTETQPPGGRRRLRAGRLALLILFVGVAILGGRWMWLRLGTYE